MANRKYVLPDTLHELQDVMMEDVGWLERDPRFLIHMEDTYLSPIEDLFALKFTSLGFEGFLERVVKRERDKNPALKCVACAAGATMYRRLRGGTQSMKMPHNFSERNEQRLEVMDRLRAGELSEAWFVLMVSLDPGFIPSIASIPEGVKDRFVPRYHLDPGGWWESMMEQHALLERLGV